MIHISANDLKTQSMAAMESTLSTAPEAHLERLAKIAPDSIATNAIDTRASG